MAMRWTSVVDRSKRHQLQLRGNLRLEIGANSISNLGDRV